jgi:hypothetical protein
MREYDRRTPNRWPRVLLCGAVVAAAVVLAWHFGDSQASRAQAPAPLVPVNPPLTGQPTDELRGAEGLSRAFRAAAQRVLPAVVVIKAGASPVCPRCGRAHDADGDAVEPAGDAGCFCRADSGWAEGLCLTDRFLKNTHEILSPLAQLTAHARLVKFEFLTKDRAVRRATFGEDAKGCVARVTANFGPTEYTAKSEMGGEVVLPTFGFLVEAPDFLVFHALSWGGRRYQKPVLFTIRVEDGRARIFHGFGDAHLIWRGRERHVPREAEVAL